MSLFALILFCAFYSILPASKITFCTHMYRYDMTQGPLFEALIFSAGYAVTVDHISVSAFGGVGVTGQQHQHILLRLDKNFVNVVGFYDLDGCGLVSQRFP